MFARHHGLSLWLAATAMGLSLAACGQRAERGQANRSGASASSIGADTSSAQRWPAGSTPPAGPEGIPSAPITRAPRGVGDGLVVAAEPDTPLTSASADSLPPPRGFKPPILRSRPALAPVGGAGTVELDLWVDARGRVARAAWVAGDRDSARVAAAIACALHSTFYPALNGGRPVAAASRQRFEFPPPR